MSKSRSLIRTARQSFATVAHHPLPPAPIWDTFVYQPIGHVDAESRASPVATSSRVTLDHLLVRPPSRLSSVPLKIAENTTNDGFADWTGAGEALAFATDEELVHALLLPHLGSTAIVGEHDWHRSLDPALAFHALRSRGSYPAFLRSIRPYIRSLFPRLRSARVHQLFVSDLLLRHPDPLVFRDILQMDGEVVQKRTVVQESGASEKLRASLVCSLYSIIRPDGRARYALTAQTNLSICRAMMQTSDWGGLERAWTDLYDTADNLPESNYQLLRFLVKLEPHRRDTAMGLFSTMVTTGTARLPMGVMGRVDDAHPEAAQLLLRTAMVKACCRWKLYQRAQTGVEEMLDVAIGGAGGVSQAVTHAVALLRQVMRVSLAAANDADLDWVGKMLLRLVDMRRDARTQKSTPRIPGRLVDAYIQARWTRGDRQAVRDIYTAISSADRGVLSTRSLLCVAEAGGDETTMRRLGFEVLGHAPEAIAGVAAPFIRALLSPLPCAVDLTEAQAGVALGLAPRVTAAQPSFTLCQHAVGVFLSSASPMSTDDLVLIVKHLRPHRALAQIMLEEQEKRLEAALAHLKAGSAHVERIGKRVENAERLAMVEGYLVHGLRAMARRQLAALDSDDPDLQADVVRTLIRSPEIKRDLQRLLGPEGMDMAWVVPEI